MGGWNSYKDSDGGSGDLIILLTLFSLFFLSQLPWRKILENLSDVTGMLATGLFYLIFGGIILGLLIITILIALG